MIEKEAPNDKEAIDDIFTNFTIVSQIATEINAAIGDIAKNIPAAVAAPFPPLNFNQIGEECPTKHKNAGTNIL